MSRNLKERMLIRRRHSDERMLIAMPSGNSFLPIKIHLLLLTEIRDTRTSGHGHALGCGPCVASVITSLLVGASSVI